MIYCDLLNKDFGVCIIIFILNLCKTYILETSVKKIGASLKCYYNGDLHIFGEVFLAIDKCNKCRCMAKGQIECSNQKCPPSTTPGNNKIHLIIMIDITIKYYAYHCLKFFLENDKRTDIEDL